MKRRFQRMRRRRKVGRAYDMALEVARALPSRANVLDVGCGNGFIAHHLSGMLGTTVVGLDVGNSTSARINYLPYDGRHFPIKDQTFDAVLLCYVLHHAHDAILVLNEVSRVLRNGGVAIIYEDIPSLWWDRMVVGHTIGSGAIALVPVRFAWRTAGERRLVWRVSRSSTSVHCHAGEISRIQWRAGFTLSGRVRERAI